MRYVLIIFCFLTISKSNTTIGSAFIPLEKTEIYSIVEYIIIENKSSDLHILNQPYTLAQIESLLANKDDLLEYLLSEVPHLYKGSNKLVLSPIIGMGSIFSEKFKKNYPIVSYTLNFNNDNIFLLTDLNIDEKYKLDNNFHGNKNLWPTGYIHNAYFQYRTNSSSFFLGRQSRNWGILNEYSLIFSNNPYSFDHIGFTTSFGKIKFSYYTSKLADLNALDLDGVSIPEGEYALSQRYWSAHRIDYIISKKIQVSLSEAVTYGGPNSNFEFTYLNPTYFYLVGQKNDQLEANNFIQLSALYSYSPKITYFLDLLIDDIIVNNNEMNERKKYPDRLGVVFKVSYANNKKLHSLRYARIWDETYRSYRTYENYFSKNKFIGFPYNSYEGVRYNFTYLASLPFYYSLDIEFYKVVNSDVITPFNETNLFFLNGDIDEYLSISSLISYKIKKHLFKLILDLENRFEVEGFNFSSQVNYSYQF
jgi:hypothetical protein